MFTVIKTRGCGLFTAQPLAGPAVTDNISSLRAPQALDVLRRAELELKVLSVIWNDGDVIVLGREDSLRRVGEGMRLAPRYFRDTLFTLADQPL